MTRTPQAVLDGKRDIFIGRAEPKYLDNSIRTAKYTFYNFFFLNLFEQFKKPANIYFLVLSVLQVIRPISISDGQPTILLPLVFVIVVAMIKDFLEDYKRTISDREENDSKVKVLKGEKIVEDKSRNILTSEIVRVERNQFIPADLFLIWSSNPKHDCFIETKSLDGETNLKLKTVPEDMQEIIRKESDIAFVEGWNFKYEEPNPHLYTFSGSITNQGKQIGIDNNSILLRGCKLKNTEYVIGLAIFTGHYTKIMKNSIKAKPKHSDLEHKLNRQIIIVFLMLVLFCTIASIMYVIWYKSQEDYISYIRLGDLNVISEFFIRLGNWILIFG